MRRWRVGNARKRAFHKYRRKREEPRREGCVETEDETEARVFQGHVRVGRTGTGMIHVAVKSWDSRNTSLARTRTFLSFCLRLFERPLCVLAGRHFRRDVILFEDGSALVLSSRNCNFYDRPYERLENWSPFRRTLFRREDVAAEYSDTARCTLCVFIRDAFIILFNNFAPHLRCVRVNIDSVRIW